MTAQEEHEGMHARVGEMAKQGGEGILSMVQWQM